MQNLEPLDQRQRLALLFASAVQRHGIKYVFVSFDGSGGSGAIDEIGVYNYTMRRHDHSGEPQKGDQLDEDALPAQTWLTRSRRARGPDGEWVVQDPGLVDCTLGDLIEDLILELASDHDWCKNDGGFGTFTFDAVTGIEFEQHTRFSDSKQVAGMEVGSTLEWLQELGVEGTA